MKTKKIFCVLLFFLIIVLTKEIYGVEIYIGDTYTFELRDLTTNNGYVASEFTGASCDKKGIVSIEEIKTGVLFVKTISQIEITGLKEGTVKITLNGSYDKMIVDAYGTQSTQTEWISTEVSVKVKDKEKEEKKAQEDIEELDTYYNKDINEMKEAHASEKLLYLRSILCNDGKNGNKNLWNKFISETTAEERKNWYRDISYNIRGTDSGRQEALDALGAQIQLDNGEATQEERDNKLEEGQDAQLEHYSTLEIKANSIGNREHQGEFVDILDNIEDYTKPGKLDEAASNKIGNMADKILTAITNIGMVIAVLMVAVLGIKYMLASVEEKAEYKKDAIPYLIGAILLFGILSFVRIFMQFGETISNL